MTNSTTFLVIDARTRDLAVYTASVTSVPALSGGLVLRKGVELGRLHDLVKPDQTGRRPDSWNPGGQSFEFPILVMGSYSAQSSAGFSSWTARSARGQTGPTPVVIVGEAGFGQPDYANPSKPWKGDCLRPRWAVAGVVFPVGTQLVAVATHRNSNCATTDASRAGVELRGQLLGRSTLIEGQSDSVSGWEFVFPVAVQANAAWGVAAAPAPTVDLAALPEEHRVETFTPARFVKNALGAGGKPEALAGTVAGLLTQIDAMPESKFDPLGPETQLTKRIGGTLTRDQVVGALAELAVTPTPTEGVSSEGDTVPSTGEANVEPEAARRGPAKRVVVRRAQGDSPPATSGDRW